ncbi:unannotated protein [freshwater metagenome]|uniref:Unannotated protein n=1 Tax=freshwater metagenome TaxID=449393 RepID=A0A6J7DH71_9ZZZZ|nr:hypothetical protein [Actinomycetota bacterium]MUH58226.1 hypothetical protein [Actinomycetota bacterium]
MSLPHLRRSLLATILISVAFVGAQVETSPSEASPVVSGHPGMGYLWNFDTSNNTDRECQGFEIQIDGVTANDVGGTYWGTYNEPTVTNTTFNGTAGIDVIYQATFDSNATTWSVSTPIGGLEHYGVSLNVAPGMQRYTWLCDDPANPGHLAQYGGSTEGNGYPMATDPSLVMTAGTTVPTVPAGGTIGTTPVQTTVTQTLVNNAPAAPGFAVGDAFFACHFELTTTQQIALGDLLTDSALVRSTLAGHQILDQCDLINGDASFTMPAANLSDDKGVTNAVYIFAYTGTYDDAHTPNCSESPTAPDYCPNDLGGSIAVDMIANTTQNRGLGIQVQGGGTVVVTPPAQPARIHAYATTAPVTCAANAVCGEVVATNAQLNLTATPNAGYVFTGWQTKLHAGSEGTCKTTVRSCTITLSKNVNLVAAFVLAPRVTITKVSATSLIRGKATVITLTGTLFARGATVRFAGSGITSTVTFKSATSLSVKVTVGKTAAKGLRTFTVTNPNATTATYTKGVTIK